MSYTLIVYQLSLTWHYKRQSWIWSNIHLFNDDV